MKLRCWFSHAAHAVAWHVGQPWSFISAILVVLIWAITGPIFGYSDTWQLVINTGTTIITFLMVFLIQNTQNRDSIAIQLKLDELLRSITEARNSVIDLDSLDESELEKLLDQYRKLAAEDQAKVNASRVAAHSAATSTQAVEAESAC
jgi:low affinity Fe/Cu permease